MAASGTINCSTTSTNDITAKITWSESDVSVANNTSKITVNLVYHKADSQYTTYGSGYFTVKINGTDYSNNHYVSFSSAGDYTVLTQTVTITHDSNGSKTVAISVVNGYVSGTTGLSATSGSGNAVLTTIARASTISCTNGNFGGSVTATVTRADSSFTHTLKFSIGASYSETKTGVGTSLAYTVPASWAASVPAGTTATMTVTCTTYSGSTQIGSATSTTCTISVPSSWAASASISASLSGTKGDSNQVLKGLTSVTLTCTGTATTGSSISSYKWSGGSTATTASISVSTSSVGSTNYTCTVTDRRGKTASKTYTVTVVDPKSSISGANSGTMGSAYALTITRLNSSFTHTVVYAINSSYTSGNRTGKTTSDSYTIPASWGAAIPSATSTNVTITCTTYNGSTSLGSVTKTISVGIPDSWKPTVSISKSYADRGANNEIITKVTTLTVTASGSGSNGSTISSYSWSGGAVSGTGNSKSHKPTTSGTYTYTCTVTDSRGRTGAATVTETFSDGQSGFTCANSVDFGAALSVSITRKKSTFTHTVRYYISSTYTHDETGQTTTSSYTIPTSWAAVVPSTSSTTMTVTVYTYESSTLVGTATKNVTVNVPSSWTPTIGSISATAVDGFGSYYLNNISKATITVSSVAASTGSTIASYKYQGNNISGTNNSTATSNSKTTNLLTVTGSNTYTVTVTDARGRTKSATVTITVTAYTKPTVNLSVHRVTSLGVQDDFGDHGRIDATGTYTSLTGNSWTLVAKYRVYNSGSSYTTVNTWSNQTGTISKSSDIFAASVDYSYECVVTISDTVGYSASKMLVLSTGKVLMDLYKDKAVTIQSTASAALMSSFGNPASLFYTKAARNVLDGDIYMPDKISNDGLTNGWFNVNDLSAALVLGSAHGAAGAHAIKSGDNIDNFVYPGSWFLSSNTTAANVSNLPIANVAGTLDVRELTGGIGGFVTYRYIQQIYHAYYENDSTEYRNAYYVRYGTTSSSTTYTWTSWKTIKEVADNKIYCSNDSIILTAYNESNKNIQSGVRNSQNGIRIYSTSSGRVGLYDENAGASFWYRDKSEAGILRSSFANVYHNGSLSWNAGNSLANVTYSTNTKAVASGTVTDVYSYTIPEDGTYLVVTDINWTSSVSVVYVHYVEAFNSGGTSLLQRYVRNSMNNGGGSGLSVLEVNLTKTDVVKLKAYQGSGSSQTARYRFACIRLRTKS